MANAAGWRPVTRSLTYQLVVAAVEAQILTGALKVGDHLPPERERATLLGASRPAVREGMRSWRRRACSGPSGPDRSGTSSLPCP